MRNISELNGDNHSITPRRAAGFRRETSQSVHWRVFSETFAGLPGNVRHPNELIDALRQARVGLRLTDSELALMADLYAATQPKDWETGRRPLAWPSNDTLASRLGKSISAVQRMVAHLIGLGLIVMRESPTGKRYGFRRADGHILKAYGFDLSLLALRFAEFKAIAAERDARNAAIREARASAAITRKRLLCLIEAAEEAGVWTTFWEDTEVKVNLVSGQLYKLRDLARLEAIGSELAALLASALAVFQNAGGTPVPIVGIEPGDNSSFAKQTRPAHRTEATLNNTTSSSSNNNCNNAPQSCKSRSAASSYPEFATSRERQQNWKGDPLDHIDIVRLIDGAPELARAIDAAAADWTVLEAACIPLLHRYEISRRLWEDAELRVGSRMVTAIFAIMLAHGRDHYQSPGGCFRRMVERHERGELNLLPSYFGLTSAAAAPSQMAAGDTTVGSRPSQTGDTPAPGHISHALARWKSRADRERN